MIGLILAGGKSKRFGQDKALFYLPGQKKRNVELIAKKIKPYCSQIFISANAKNQASLRQLFDRQDQIQIITDQVPYLEHGPLSGLYALLARINGMADILMIAVDYPYLQDSDIKKLLKRPSYLCTEQDEHYTLAHLRTSRQELIKFLDKNNWHLKDFIKQNCQAVLVKTNYSLTNLNYRSEILKLKNKEEMSQPDFQKLIAIVLDDLSIRRTLLENREQEVNQEMRSLEKDAELERLDNQVQAIQADYDHYKEFVDPEIKFDLENYYTGKE